jgi:outer membrane scaffolding protein for murein synthesis (MipA/OmpV family)
LGDGQGTYGTVGVSAQRQLAARWVGGLSTGATVADRKNMAFEFGVTPEQSVRRRALIAGGDLRLKPGDGATYTPGAGLRQVQGSATLAYLLTQRTRAMLFAQGTRLSSEAARSPIVRQRTSAATGVALGYAF